MKISYTLFIAVIFFCATSTAFAKSVQTNEKYIVPIKFKITKTLIPTPTVIGDIPSDLFIRPIPRDITVSAKGAEALISWKTDEPSIPLLTYGDTSDYREVNEKKASEGRKSEIKGGAAANNEQNTMHTLAISGLTPGQHIYFNVKSEQETAAHIKRGSVELKTLSFQVPLDGVMEYSFPNTDLTPPTIRSASIVPAANSIHMNMDVDGPAKLRVNAQIAPITKSGIRVVQPLEAPILSISNSESGLFSLSINSLRSNTRYLLFTTVSDNEGNVFELSPFYATTSKKQVEPLITEYPKITTIKQPTLSPVPVKQIKKNQETAQWRLYKNSANKFSFKYPMDFVLSSEENRWILSPSTEGQEVPFLFVEVLDKKFDTLITDAKLRAINNSKEYPNKVTVRNIRVAKHTATQVSVVNGVDDTTSSETYIKRNKNVLLIKETGFDKRILEKLFLQFKFF